MFRDEECDILYVSKNGSETKKKHGRRCCKHTIIVEGMNMAKKERFEKTYSQGTLTVTEIWVDKETGVNYVFHASGYAGGMTPLLDREGKPVITAVIN